MLKNFPSKASFITLNIDKYCIITLNIDQYCIVTLNIDKYCIITLNIDKYCFIEKDKVLNRYSVYWILHELSFNINL